MDRIPAKNPQNQVITAMQMRLEKLELRLHQMERKTSFMSPYPEPLTMRKITNVVAGYYQITNTEIFSQNRAQTYRMPRNIAIYLCKTLLDLPLNEIARHFMRDPGTIRHAINVVEKQKKRDTAFAHQVQILSARLKV